MTQLDLELFFEDPELSRWPPEKFGILYLLRHDINCSLANGNEWLAALGIFAGLDLLGACLSGDDSPENLFERFERFTDEYFPLRSLDHFNLLYKIRSAMMHSSGLHSTELAGAEYGFTAIAGNKDSCSVLELSASQGCILNVTAFHECFEIAVKRFGDDAKRNRAGIQANFSRMLPKYEISRSVRFHRPHLIINK